MQITKSAFVVFLVILGFAGFLFFFSQPQKGEKAIPGGEAKPGEPIEIFSMAGLISAVNEKESYLLVRRSGEQKDVKVVLSKDSELVQLKFPFDPNNPPKEASFVPEKISIGIGDLAVGDNVLIEAKENIYGKTEFDSVSRIQALP